MSSIQNYLSGLSTSEKLAALNLLWNDLEHNLDDIPSPDWHTDVIDERLSNPSTEPSMSVDDAMARIKERMHASKGSD